MAIFDRVKAAYNGLVNPTQQVANKLYQAVYSFFSGYFYTLTTNKKTYVDSGYRSNSTVYSLVKLIAGKGANAHLKAVKFDNKGNVIEMPRTSWIAKLLKKPNEFERQQQFIEACLSWLLITGDLYLYKVVAQTGNDRGKAIRWYTLPSQYVQIIGGGMFDPVEGYKLIIGDQEVEFTKDEVTHIRYFNPNWDISGSQLYGQSPLEAALKTIQSSNEATNAKIRAFINGGMHGLLSSKDPNQQLTIEEISQLNGIIENRVTGTDNTKKISATSGMVEYTQIGMSPADLEILKSLEFDSQELCRVFGVDPILLSVEAASYNNKSEAYKSLVNNVVVPLLNLFQDCLNESINDAEIEIVYDISHFPELQEDLKQQVDALKGADWLTLNEKRGMMNKEPLKDALMDKIYISTSLVPLEEVNIDMSLNNNGDFE